MSIFFTGCLGNVEWNCFIDFLFEGVSIEIYPHKRDQFGDLFCTVHKGVVAYFPIAVVK